ncbi:MAG TPA: hypothetical protein VFC31_04910 [Candidatus Limnocylindria bacterium]|nr:hypothetical protein [Candidatus Limnocylindria bacterium]
MRDWSGVFRAIPASLRHTLPADLRDFRWKSTSWMAKAWYGNPALHYEIWVRHHAKVVEVGLHFEADELTNARLLGAFRSRAKQVKRALGAGVRIEEWDRGWSRVWEPFALGDDGVGERVGQRFEAYVAALEPILRDELPAEVAWKLPAGRRTKVTSSRASRSGRR